MNDKLTATKEIIVVQGFGVFLRKFKKFYFSSDKADIKKAVLDSCDGYRVFIDIGANQGPITLGVCNKFEKCICFEPLEKPYNEFKKTIKEQKLDNILLYPLALGERKETETFYVSPRPGRSRFNVAENENWPSKEVQIDILDDILEKLGINEKAIIKIDVEGYELFAMKGAKKILEQDCVVITEFNPCLLNINKSNPFDYVEYMKKLGYSFFDLNGKPIKDSYINRMCKIGINKINVADDFLLKKV